MATTPIRAVLVVPPKLFDGAIARAWPNARHSTYASDAVPARFKPALTKPALKPAGRFSPILPQSAPFIGVNRDLSATQRLTQMAGTNNTAARTQTVAGLGAGLKSPNKLWRTASLGVPTVP